MNKYKKINIKKITKKIALATFSLFIAFGPLTSLFAPNVAEAKDADHQGMVYLSVKLNPSSNNITSVVDSSETGNAVFRTDTKKSPEYKSEGILYGTTSWKNSSQILSGSFPSFGFVNSNKGSWFTSSDSGSKFSDWADDNLKDQTDNLVMSFPGWGAGDTVQNLASGENKKFDRNDDKTPKEFAEIDDNTATGAAGEVNNKLVGDFNKALDLFYSRVISSDDKGSVTLSKEGLANMVFLVASGYMPKDKKTNIRYDAENYTFNMEDLSQGKLKAVKNPWSKDKAGATVVKYETPGEISDGDDQTYTYAVAKGYMNGVGKQGSKKYATDEYALSWMDIAIAANANAFIGDSSSSSASSNETVVGDQVNGLVYGMLSGALSLLGVKTADELVFGKDGALFKNGTYKIYMAIMVPFIILAILILSLVIIDAFRKSNMRYISTGQVESIQKSVGRVTNAVIMIAITPILIVILTSLDQVLVGLASALNEILIGVIGTNIPTDGGFLSGLKTAATGSITGIVLAVMLCWVNLKFTWRYIARTISFGMYFLASPIVFALDALKGQGGIFEYGPMTADVWKNLTGLILQRSIDAFGIVIAINLGRVIFGQGMLISIVGYLSIAEITKAILAHLGIRDSSISSIADAGRKLHSSFNRGVGMAIGATAATVGANGMAAVASGSNVDKMSYLNSLDKKNRGSTVFNKFGETTSSGGGTGGSFSAFDVETGIKDKDGNPISVNEGGVRSSKAKNAFSQGFFNSGVAYDKNSLGKKEGVINDNHKFNPNDFTTDNKGNIVRNRQLFGTEEGFGKNAGGYISSLGRQAGTASARFAGGASSAFRPMSLAKTVAGSALVGAAQMTPTKWDNILGYSLLANNMENTITGKNRKLTTALGSSFAARMIGLNSSAFDFDDVTANGNSSPTVPMKNGSGGNIGKSSAPEGIFNTLEGDSQSGYNSFTAYSPGVKDRDASQMLSSTSNFAREFGTDNHMDDNGIYNFSRDDIAKQIYNPNDETVNQDAINMLNHMDTNGFSNISYDGSNVGMRGSVEQETTAVKDLADGSRSKLLADKAANSINGTITDQVTGATYQYSPGETEDLSKLSVFTPFNKPENLRHNLEVQDATNKIMKAKNVSREDKGLAIKDMYSSPNNFEVARDQVNFLDNLGAPK